MAMDPDLGGVIITSRRGTGKSVLAQGPHPPPPLKSCGAVSTTDPYGPQDWDPITRERWAAVAAKQLPTHFPRNGPWGPFRWLLCMLMLAQATTR